MPKTVGTVAPRRPPILSNKPRSTKSPGDLLCEQHRNSLLNSGNQLNVFDITNQHCVFRNACDLGITVAKMGAGSESAGASRANPLQTISESGHKVPVSNNPYSLLIFGYKVSLIKLNIVSEQYAATFL